MPLLLLFRRGYGDWPERPVAPAAAPVTAGPDRLLIAPKQAVTPRPVQRPTKRNTLR